MADFAELLEQKYETYGKVANGQRRVTNMSKHFH